MHLWGYAVERTDWLGNWCKENGRSEDLAEEMESLHLYLTRNDKHEFSRT
jgi:hypothetical protein